MNQNQLDFSNKINIKIVKKLQERFPTSKIYRIDKTDEENRVYVDDLINNVDAVIMTGFGKEYKCQFKSRMKTGKDVCIELKSYKSNDSTMIVNGAYYHQKYGCWLFPKFGNFDILCMYIDNKVFIFLRSILENLFCYESFWSDAQIYPGPDHNGEYMFFMPPEKIMDYYNRCFAYLSVS